MESSRGAMPSQEPQKDFAYYVPWVREATKLYDLAIENEVYGPAMVNMKALEECQEICEELLADRSLPLEDRILLNYYMCAYRSKHVSIFYLRQALATVERLEALEGGIDPMREIVETQLRLAGENANAPSTPVTSVAPMQQWQHWQQWHPEPGYGSFEGPSQRTFPAATEQIQIPTVIITEPSPPNPRPGLIRKIRQATARREKAKAEEEAAGYMNIDG